MEQKLRPCPFCGGRAKFSRKGLSVICQRCSASIAIHPIHRTMADYSDHLARLWNRRTPAGGFSGQYGKRPAEREKAPQEAPTGEGWRFSCCVRCRYCAEHPDYCMFRSGIIQAVETDPMQVVGNAGEECPFFALPEEGGRA